MTEAEKAYHHVLQYWWKRAQEAEADKKRLQEENKELRDAVWALQY